MPFGPLDTTCIDFPANIDESYIAGLENREGVTFPTIIQEIDSRMAALNTSIDPWLANKLAPPTTEKAIDSTNPIEFEVTESSEYSVPRPQLAEGSGYMLPIRHYDISLKFTERFLLNATMAKVLQQVDSVALGFRKRYLKDAAKRLLSNAEVRVDPSISATSPGFAGSGTGLNAFVGPYPDGTALPGGYTHFYVANTSNAGEFKTILKAMLARLLMWNEGPFNFTANKTVTALITAMTGSDPMDSFVPAGSAYIRTSTGVSEALVDPAMYLGVLFGNILVEHPKDITASPIGTMYKSFGNLHPNNPLVWRYDDMLGRNAYVRYRDFFPLSQAIVLQDYGIGVNNRTAVANVYAAAGASSYVNPTDL